MYWNCRVVKHIEDGEEILEVCEVYYNSLGQPCAYCVASASGETVEDLQQYVDRMMEATAYPILEYNKDFGAWDSDHLESVV